MKTAMQQIITILNQNDYESISKDYTVRLLEVVGKGIEKQQIIDAWVDGGKMISQVEAKNGEQYYSETFK